MRNRIGLSLIWFSALLAGLASFPTAAAEHSFVGSKKCKMCHMKEWQSWSQTKMGNAFEALKPGARAEAKKKAGLDPAKDYTADATCLPCHTTGYGKPGGFVDIDSTPALAGVGCEMCHGAGGTYTESQFMSLQNKEYRKSDVVTAGLTGTIGPDQCVACHNTDSPFVGASYQFDFEAMKSRGTHEKSPLKYQH